MEPDEFGASRRGFMKTSLGAACCAAASPLLSPVTVAAAPGERRLAIIILRGAMDGLDVFAPYGDPDYAALRPGIGVGGDEVIDLDGRFGMHPGLSPLAPLWNAGELAIAHAVSTPYRGKRSHFDGQDILEAGVAQIGGVRDGWVNRALAFIPDARPETALSVGAEAMLLTSGERATRAWAPGARLMLDYGDDALLSLLYRDDPLFADAAASAAAMSEKGGADRKGAEPVVAAKYAAERLRDDARIAAFSLGGWDTHIYQPGAIKRPVRMLGDALVTMRRTLGPAWDDTVVIAMTEFGRTARENGARGTDHGTGGAAVMAGGAVKGGKVFGRWPGLKESDLYEGRDLAATTDVRLYPAWALAALFGIERAALERDVFPGLDMGERPGFIA